MQNYMYFHLKKKTKHKIGKQNIKQNIKQNELIDEDSEKDYEWKQFYSDSK